MGGDRGPEEVVAGALDARSDTLTPILFGSAGIETHGLELIETVGVIEMDDKPAEAVRAKPDSSLVAAVRAVADGSADAVVSAGNTGAMLAAGLLELRRLPGVLRPAIAIPIPSQRPDGAPRRRRERRRAARAPAPVRDDGRRLRRGDARHREPGGAAPLDRRGAGEGEPADARGARAARRERPQLRRQHRGPRPPRGHRRRRRHRRLHRERRAEAPRRRDPDAPRSAPRRRSSRRRGGSSAAC